MINEQLTLVRDIEKILSTLDNISQKCVPDSLEQKVVEIAAHAIHFVYQETVFEEFKKNLEQCHKPITPEQEQYLRKVGVIPKDIYTEE